MSADNRPTHNLCVKRREGVGPWIRIGAAWINDKGQFNLVLDPGASLSWRDMDDLGVMLFPNKHRDGKEASDAKTT